MKKILIFMMLVLISFSFTSCDCFEDPADIEVVGYGKIEKKDGVLIVDVEGDVFVPHRVYTNSRKYCGRDCSAPLEDMDVTVFYLRKDCEPSFIVGHQTPDYLEYYFTDNYTFVVIFSIIAFIFFILYIFLEIKSKRQNIEY